MDQVREKCSFPDGRAPLLPSNPAGWPPAPFMWMYVTARQPFLVHDCFLPPPTAADWLRGRHLTQAGPIRLPFLGIQSSELRLSGRKWVVLGANSVAPRRSRNPQSRLALSVASIPWILQMLCVPITPPPSSSYPSKAQLKLFLSLANKTNLNDLVSSPDCCSSFM